MKKILCAALCCTVFLLCGCMGIGESKPDIAITTYNSPIKDGGEGSKYLDGLKLISKDAKSCFFENINENEFRSNLKKMSSEGHSFIFITQRYGWEDLKRIAAEYPDQSYGIADVYDTPLPSNVTAINYRYSDGTYLAGFVAGKTISGKKIGILCENEDEQTKKYIYSFMAGVMSSGNNIEFEEKYIGKSYNNEKSERAALELFKSGCELVFNDLLIPDGVISAAEKSKKYVIGIGTDQSVKSAQTVLTTVTVNNDIAFSSTLRKFINGENIGGKAFEFGMSNYTVSLAKTITNIDKSVLDEANRIKEKIANGSFKVPDTAEEVNIKK